MASSKCEPSTSKTVQLALREASQVPSYENAHILSEVDASRVELLLSQTTRDLTRDTKRRTSTFVSFNADDNDEPKTTEYSFEESSEVVMTVAHEYVVGERIIFRSCESEKPGKDKRLFVERWSPSSVEESVEVTGRHGVSHADATFGAVSFHPQRHSRIAYIAEAKKPDDSTCGKYEYVDDWGEKLEGKSSPVVVVLDFEGGLPATEDEGKGNVIVHKPNQNTACGSVIFTPEGDRITYVATEIHPRRYGLYACYNRRSALVRSDYAGHDHEILTSTFEHARSPNYNILDGCLYFLTNAAAGAHAQCSSLQRLSPLGKFTEILPIVPTEAPAQPPMEHTPPTPFTGLYPAGTSYLHPQCRHMFFTSQLRSTTRVMSCVLQATWPRKMKDIIPEVTQLPSTSTGEDRDTNSWAIIGAGKGQLVLANHESHGAIELRHVRLANQRHGIETHTTFLCRPSPSPELMRTDILTYPEKPFVESILLRPTTAPGKLLSSPSGKTPLVVLLHGGPHAAASTTYSAYNAALVMLGCAVLRVNYTGSTGFGSDSTDALTGGVGGVDVEDCRYATQDLLQREEGKEVDGGRIAIMGGSHGGFIGAWLLGKWPDMFKCGVLLNPVINMATVGAASDIPDWAISEAIRPPHDPVWDSGKNQTVKAYDLAKPPLPSSDMYSQLWKASPMSVANRVKAPVLMLLGGKDKRVPNYEGKNYVHYLKSRSVETKCYMFPDDGHSLDSGDAYRGVFEAIGTFLHEHL